MKKEQVRLFVIIDPEADQQIALSKALSIAAQRSCHVHASLCIHKEMDEAGKYASRKDFKRSNLAEAESWLEQIMQPCRTSEVPYSTGVIWNSDWVKSSIRAALKFDCGMMIKSSFQHSKARRFFSKTSDYQLMRQSTFPVLFTHRIREWENSRLLACLDLESSDPNHTRLNAEIMKNASWIAENLGMDLYLACAHKGRIDPANLKLDKPAAEVTPELLGELYDIDPARIMLRQGRIVDTLKQISVETSPDIVMMGTVARKGVRGKLVGNTAEKMLDLVDADVLTVN